MLTKIQSPSRRTFLQGSLGALFLAVGANGVVWAADIKKYGADAMPGGTVDDPLVFVSIAADGAVTIVAHRAEMGRSEERRVGNEVVRTCRSGWSPIN